MSTVGSWEPVGAGSSAQLSHLELRPLVTKTRHLSGWTNLPLLSWRALLCLQPSSGLSLILRKLAVYAVVLEQSLEKSRD